MGKVSLATNTADHDLSQKPFIGSVIGMSWQMAVTVLLPTIVGIKLDSHYQTDPVYTLCGLLFAIVATIIIVRRVIKELNIYMLQDDAAETAGKKDSTTTK